MISRDNNALSEYRILLKRGSLGLDLEGRSYPIYWLRQRRRTDTAVDLRTVETVLAKRVAKHIPEQRQETVSDFMESNEYTSTGHVAVINIIDNDLF